MERKTLRWIIILLIIGLILSVFGFWALTELSRYEHSVSVYAQFNYPWGTDGEIDILYAGFIVLGILMLGRILLIIGGILLMIKLLENHNSNKT
jgi:hypothetical protein